MAAKILGNVDADNPVLRGAIISGVKQGMPLERIGKIVGVPYEVCKKYEREAKEEIRREKKRKR